MFDESEARPDPCPVLRDHACEWIDLGRFPDRSGKVGHVRAMRCAACGVGISRPAISDVAFLYADRESQDFQPRTDALTRTIKRFVFKRQAIGLLRRLRPAPRTIIDFACGSGLFTSAIHAAASGARVIGTDFHDTPPRELDGPAYVSLARVDELTCMGDLVLAMHVIEHDDDPTALLDKIRCLVAPKGALIVEVPNIDCVWIKIFGRYWDAWYLPYHRIHFNRNSLRALVEKAGLRVEKEENVSVPTMGRTLAHMLGCPNGLPFILIGAMLHPLQWAMEALTRRPVAIRVIARAP